MQGERTRVVVREPRDYTLAERRAEFAAFRSLRLREMRAKREAEQWSEVEHDLTSDQIEAIPPGRPGDTNRSAPVWVRYLHRRLGRYVVAQGRYLYDKDCWIARTEPQGLRDRVELVDAIEWAPLQPGRKPGGFVVPDRIKHRL